MADFVCETTMDNEVMQLVRVGDTLCEVITDYYENCQLKYEYRVDHTTRKKHGLYKDFHSNSNVKTECNYVNDEKHGFYFSYHYNGKCSSKRTYNNGVVVEVTNWDSTGKVRSNYPPTTLNLNGLSIQGLESMGNTGGNSTNYLGIAAANYLGTAAANQFVMDQT